MEIDVLIEEGVAPCLEASWLQDIAGQVLTARRVSPDVELGLVIAGQERVQQLNRDYLGRDRPTDVIAFSMLPEQSAGGEHFVPPPDGVLHLGEVIIAYPQAVVQAEEQGHSTEKEIAILVIHGILHLLGYDDEKPELKREMRAREKEILSQIEGGES
ncbi:rRNA maturation RNase YbeY [Chloroflexota bacterium]